MRPSVGEILRNVTLVKKILNFENESLFQQEQSSETESDLSFSMLAELLKLYRFQIVYSFLQFDVQI